MARHARSSRGSRRQSTWFSIPATSTAIVSGSVLSASLNAAALAMRPFTIVRTHLSLFVVSDQAAAVEQQEVGIGFAVVSDQAVAIGVTAVPTPISDIGSDLWYLHKMLYADESSLTDRSKAGQQYTVDSKAMRKVDGDQDSVLVFEVRDKGAILLLGGRMLIKTN